MTTNELKARTKQFALRLVRLVDAFAILAASRKSAIGNRKSAIH